MSVLAQLAEGATIAVLRLRSLGDCVLTTPALRILKSALPGVRIAVVVEHRFADLFAGNPDVAEILEPSVAALRRCRPELCLNLHGGTRSISLTALSGARLRAGFAHFRGSGVYNLRIPTAQEILGVNRVVHTAEHLASAIFWLGAPRVPIPRAQLYPMSQSGLSDAGVRPAYAVLHPIAALLEKTWPAANFIELARRIQSDLGFRTVFIGGPDDDLRPFSEFKTIAGSSLEATKSLLSEAQLFIGNDSGPAHMAAAFGVPSVVLFGPSDPRIWAPWQVDAHVLQADPITGITIDEVISAASSLQSAKVSG